MESALAQSPQPLKPVAVKDEFGPLMRVLAQRYFEDVRFPPEAEAELKRMHDAGFVVHVMRSTSWVNYLYLTWALLRRGLPPVRAVVNLRPWFTRPWSNTLQKGEFDVRFTFARRMGGSGLIFLRKSALGIAEGRSIKEDPFPALVALARKAEKPVFLIPELFVWERSTKRITPRLVDRIFGSPDVPGFLHSVVVFWRNHQRAQFRIGEPIDLRKFISENPEDSDALIARKIRGALHLHLARETRAVFGPPLKPAERVIEETLRDRTLQKALAEIAQKTNRKPESVTRQARKDLNAIASRMNPTFVGLTAPVLNAVFQKIYDGIEVDEAGFERAMRAAAKAPIVLCPSHKSHIDYLVMSWVMWNRGYTIPIVAAGANLSFWPLGYFLRRGGAYFLRRSFKDDPVYGAAFKGYLKKLVHEGVLQEFFPEGGRSRTGKLLPAKLGMFTWLVDAVLDGARQDLQFVPVAIDYERIVESSSYSKELAGGEKKPEDLKALLSAPKVLSARYGRIQLTFDEPISLADFAAARGINVRDRVTDDQKKGLVRALGHRVMWGIGRVSTITPHALVSAALLAWRGRGIGARQVGDHIGLIRRLAERDGTPVSSTLKDAPSDPAVLGAISEAIRTFCREEMVRVTMVRGEAIYQPVDERRAELSFYKNTLMNWIAPRSLVANAVLASGAGGTPFAAVKERALFLSRLFKLEFIYRVGVTFDTIFEETVIDMERAGLLTRKDDALALAPEAHARGEVEFLADLLRDYLEAYLIGAVALEDLVSAGSLDKKAFIKDALEIGRAEFLSGRVTSAEAVSRTILENALAWFLDRQMVVEMDKKLVPGPAGDKPQRDALTAGIRTYLRR